jgi:hypothetical protein
MVSYELVTKDHEFSLDSVQFKPNLVRRFGWSMNQLLQIINLGQDPELLRKEYVSGVFNSLLTNYRKQLEGLEENVEVQRGVVDKIRQGIVRLESEIGGYETTIDSSYKLDMRRLYDGNDSDEPNWSEFLDAEQLEGFKAKMQIDLETILGADDTEFNVQFKVTKGDYSRAYAQGVHALQEACKNSTHPQEFGVYRPLTFRENLQARVNDYTSNEGDKLRLFQTWLDSCCGVAYKGGTTKFKIVPRCRELVTIQRDFNQGFFPIDYDSVQGVELDFSQGKYRTLLTQQEVLEHPAWLAAVEGDKDLLKVYSEIIFAERSGKNMGFWVWNQPSQDQLRALFVYSLGYGSSADGSYLDYRGSFLRVVAPQRAP